TPEKLYSLYPTKDARGQWTAILQFPGGTTALVSEAHGSKAAPGVSLMVLGNKGALYHAYDAGRLHTWEGASASLDDPPVPAIPAAREDTREKGTPATLHKWPETPAPKPPKRPEPKVKYGVLIVTGSHTHQENYAAAFAADKRCRIVALTDEKDIDRRR